jgi:hypothetical protein
MKIVFLLAMGRSALCAIVPVNAPKPSRRLKLKRPRVRKFSQPNVSILCLGDTVDRVLREAILGVPDFEGDSL